MLVIVDIICLCIGNLSFSKLNRQLLPQTDLWELDDLASVRNLPSQSILRNNFFFLHPVLLN
jgi:hypothetical protein